MEKATAPHSRTLAWKIPWMEEPGATKSWTRLSDFTYLLQAETNTTCKALILQFKNMKYSPKNGREAR